MPFEPKEQQGFLSKMSNKVSSLFRKTPANPLNNSSNGDLAPFSRDNNESQEPLFSKSTGGKRKSRRKRKQRKTHKKR